MTSFGDTARLRFAAAWPAVVGALAVCYATIGAGWPPRRSAIAFMIGSWGARLAVQALYTRTSLLPLLNSYLTLLISALLFSLPAWLASRNADEGFSAVELAAAGLWLIAFAAERTADRQRLRVAPVWLAVALFSAGSPWGWIAFVCPAALLYLQFTRRY